MTEDPYKINHKPISLSEEVKAQQKQEQQAKFKKSFANVQYRMIYWWQNFSVEYFAKRVGVFLKLFHESMASLV